MLIHGKTDIGLKRNSNQDCFVTEALAENAALCVVCDGMGGASGGSEAGRTAIETFVAEVADFTRPLVSETGGVIKLRLDGADLAGALRAAVDTANSRVYNYALENAALEGMGTTLVAALAVDRELYSVNVGDSRLYAVGSAGMTGGIMTQLTRDHSFVQYLIDIGKLTPEEAKTNPHRNILLQVVGPNESVPSDVEHCTLAEDIKFLLLCSDGLTNMIEDDEIAAIVMGAGTIEAKADRLIERACENGGSDNITVALVEL